MVLHLQMAGYLHPSFWIDRIDLLIISFYGYEKTEAIIAAMLSVFLISVSNRICYIQKISIV